MISMVNRFCLHLNTNTTHDLYDEEGHRISAADLPLNNLFAVNIAN